MKRLVWDDHHLLSEVRAGVVSSWTPGAGKIVLGGKDPLDLLHRISTNAVNHLAVGHAARTILTTEKGRIVDLLTLARLESGLVLLCSPDRTSAVHDWVERFVIMDDVTIEGATSSIACCWLTGNDVFSVASPRPGVALSAGTCVELDRETLAVGVENRGGTHVFIAGPEESVRSRISDMGLSPLADTQAELLRILLCLPRSPNELNLDFTPYDAAISDLVSFTKGCYIGQEVIARLDTYHKVRRGLVGLEFDQVPDVSAPAAVSDGQGEIGRLTSVAYDPALQTAFALAVLRLDALAAGGTVWAAGPEAIVQGRVARISPDHRSA